MLPIMANKIENSAGTGKPISQEFTTETLSATTSISTPSLNVASSMLAADSTSVTADVPVTINNTLDVKPGDTSVLTANSSQVTINKPTNITGTTGIKGNIQISKSSSEATDGNLTVAGTGSFGDKLTVSSNGASITGETTVSGNLINKNGTFKANKITVNYGDGSSGYKVELDSNSNNIISVFGNRPKDEGGVDTYGKIFSVDVTNGET